MAKAVVDSNKSTIPITLVNLTSKNVKIEKNFTVASLQPVCSVTKVKGEADSQNKNETPDHLKPLLAESSETLNHH
ncbi:hypothetical protein DPMN_013830 [Dreissena polymorpha]|uniref:Uncharacterized protein n=1 Tax=Dreissena polymorpha TaxID=45954 RepID=A0A9D4NAJ0_DREPO|nr:hypothetical protein DPMN_013830 [Dreissena polymorpha]